MNNKRWSVGINPEAPSHMSVYIADLNFKHDIRLYVNGDFRDIEENITVALNICSSLNNIESLKDKTKDSVCIS